MRDRNGEMVAEGDYVSVRREGASTTGIVWRVRDLDIDQDHATVLFRDGKKVTSLTVMSSSTTKAYSVRESTKKKLSGAVEMMRSIGSDVAVI